jgi:hypothetical protein
VKTTNHHTTAPAVWAPTPEEFARLEAEAMEAIQQSKAGQPVTQEQANLILWICMPLPQLFPPAHLKA